MTSLPNTDQEQPSFGVLQRKSSNIARQTAANRSNSAYAVPAVGSKGHKQPASASPLPSAGVSPGMVETAGEARDSLETQPISDTTENVLSVEDDRAALTASIPGQVEAQEHRSAYFVAAAKQPLQVLACFQIAHRTMQQHLSVLPKYRNA